MHKIPTVLRRDPDDMRHVLPEVTPGCEWVLAGEGVPTRKYDGTCVMLDDNGKWWARREVKPGKTAPAGFVSMETDETTGKTVGWEPVEQSSYAKLHAQVLADPLIDGDDLTPGTYELVGPKVNGNPERVDRHALLAHDNAEVVDLAIDPPTVSSMPTDVTRLAADHGAEGIVWHHPDGRMAKLKARDFA